MAVSGKRVMFTENEKSILVNLVFSNIEVLEDKRNTADAIAIKQQAWKKLSEKFNSYCSVRHFSAQQLKKCWMNMKSKSKKEDSRENKGRVLNDGGSPSLQDSTMQKLYSLIPGQLQSFDNNLYQQNKALSYTVSTAASQTADESKLFEVEEAAETHQLSKENEAPSSERYLMPETNSTSQEINSKDEAKIKNSPIVTLKGPYLSTNVFCSQTKRKPELSVSSSTTMPSFNQQKRKQNDKSEDSFLQKLELEHELRVKKLKLEIEYAKEEHIAKMKQYSQNLNESLSTYCKHCE